MCFCGSKSKVRSPVAKAEVINKENALRLLERGDYKALKDRYFAIEGFFDWRFNNLEYSIFHLAVYEKRKELVEMILTHIPINDSKDLFNQKDVYDNLPIHLAAIQNDADMIAYLRQKGSPIQSLNKNNDTPFSLAQKFKSMDAAAAIDPTFHPTPTEEAKVKTIIKIHTSQKLIPVCINDEKVCEISYNEEGLVQKQSVSHRRDRSSQESVKFNRSEKYEAPPSDIVADVKEIEGEVEEQKSLAKSESVPRSIDEEMFSPKSDEEGINLNKPIYDSHPFSEKKGKMFEAKNKEVVI